MMMTEFDSSKVRSIQIVLKDPFGQSVMSQTVRTDGITFNGFVDTDPANPYREAAPLYLSPNKALAWQVEVEIV